ncbi:glycoside hydrolase family 5 protein [Baudoinia panamericana UAMH 10762]|uniref:Glycoside hydrolase family 5 protein n=1 Tax=Baudoinia panamericana (strain UAMH 10762) TaxID=717646 RepID=M2MTE0_BAUPA|nr:glycoside hydrolase family 5 protein [Baudoinia panamericana UAMH 10762]EMD00162.1 glycoside hydrolase family 5 protein [Baudoinia panamericana UAMH 10762]
MAPPRLYIDGQRLRDKEDHREFYASGINVSGDSKLPAHPPISSHVKEQFFDGDSVSFVDRPFSVAEAHTHFSRLKRWGYNTIRYIFTWEALEHEGPGRYDEDFIQHTVKILRIAGQYGFHVYMDPHQDVWSRYTGGSGAPMWTIYACGFDPTKFATTQAALVQNTWPVLAEFPKMAWATNYQRLACQTIFTFFFAGREFAPKCIIDGKNIQDYLQDHFIAACRHLAKRITEAGDLEGDVVLGFETVNEPNKGFIGHPDLSKLPEDQKLRKYTTPTAWQAMLSGSGRAVEVDTYDFGSFGPYKSGTQKIEPNGTSAWLDPGTWDDSKYGWKRAESWRLGEDVWAQHGVWNPAKDEILLPHYFAKHPKTGAIMNQDHFTNNEFMDYYRKHRDVIRSVWPETIMLIQPSPFEVPPIIKGTADDETNMIFASHFYDGITLITKKWNKLWNVDVLGLLRGKYSSPAFAIKVGETAIRNCFKDQLSTVRQEGINNMGEHPCLFTEIGIPYDMDAQHAYMTGDYSSQAAAIDANHYAVEGSQAAGFTWWVYTVSNNHFWGDNWNGEDLSIYSSEDRQLPPSSYEENASKLSLDPSSPSYSESQSEANELVTPGSLKKTLSVGEMDSSVRSISASETPGFRAAEAYVRPHPELVHGSILSHGFDLKSCTFSLTLNSTTPTPQDYPTVVFLPEFHFPQQRSGASAEQRTTVEVSGGKWEIRIEEIMEDAPQQILKWWHGEGEQKIVVKGVKRKRGTLQPREEEEGYMDAYWQMGRNCRVM